MLRRLRTSAWRDPAQLSRGAAGRAALRESNVSPEGGVALAQSDARRRLRAREAPLSCAVLRAPAGENRSRAAGRRVHARSPRVVPRRGRPAACAPRLLFGRAGAISPTRPDRALPARLPCRAAAAAAGGGAVPDLGLQGILAPSGSFTRGFGMVCARTRAPSRPCGRGGVSAGEDRLLQAG